MFRKNEHAKELVAVLAAIMIVTAAVNIYLVWNIRNSLMEGAPGQRAPETGTVSLPTLEGYVPVDIKTEANSIILTSGCRQISMVTTPHQIYSIENGLDGKIDTRPTTHDIMADILETYGIRVLEARVDDMKDGAYYATLILQKNSRVLVQDTRPSDAIGIALRFGVPVYLSEHMLDAYGKAIC